jgi:hypothetical protein
MIYREYVGFIDGGCDTGFGLDEKKALRWLKSRRRIGMDVAVKLETYNEEGTILRAETQDW